jgi:hypothetical protein
VWGIVLDIGGCEGDRRGSGDLRHSGFRGDG